MFRNNASTIGPDSEPDDQAAEKYAVASRWRLVWRRFRNHKLAMAGLIVTILVYVVAVFGEFLAPYSTSHLNDEYTYAPPQRLQIVDTSGDDWDWGLHVNGYTMERDPETLAQEFTTDPDNKVPVGFFVKGEEYELFGLIPWDRHLIGPVDSDTPMYLLGADQMGRDQFSRIIHGTRISMSVGLVGVAMGFVLGILLGGISGYFGGRTDTIVQRAVELFMSLPTLPLWLGLAAAIPRDWGSVERYFAITVVLSLVAWTGLARDVRGRFMSLREEDFVTSARLDGTGEPRIIFGHVLPSFTSHLIATLTLSIPTMILAETALSFLGLGLQPPTVSWGVLLQEAQNIRVISTAPWLLLPGVAVVVAILALNFLGDGLRDAADPYKH
ncbi:peptide/nickel transport system permease protein [Haloactinopolyspora alba]|uniref:Peptide/nickel transport system permease protein n=1 Tax=Haloactinopolyspora alba TaxID=648780 RepID=A0A2P8DZS1_9ACTN|nr:ABC transporter permease [Haloactinopolyspora alba]PSL02716.1 peptide/nickel transport system permease protein [Haloactinopolyspora alba]